MPRTPRRELQIDVHAVVREQHDRLRALRARFVDDLLQLLLADAEGPVGDEIARMRDRRVGKRLADDRDRHAVDCSRITYGAKTGSPKSAVLTFCARNAMRPLRSSLDDLPAPAPRRR